jgi:hypothetical protein
MADAPPARRFVTVRVFAIGALVGVLLTLVGVAAPVAVVRRWPEDPATRPGPLSWYVQAEELEPGTPSEPNRDVLVYQTRLGGMVEEFLRVPDGVNVLMNYRIAEGYARQEQEARDRARQWDIENGRYPAPRLPVVPRPPQALRERTERSREMLARIPDADTVFVRSGWPWHAGEGLRFPVRPVWGGLLANVLFFMGLTLAPLLAWRLWSAWGVRRARRGVHSMAGRRHRIVSRGVVVKSLIVGLVLAITSVPVTAVVASLVQHARQQQQQQRQQTQTPPPAPDYVWISTPESFVGFYRTGVPGGVVWSSLAMEPKPPGVVLADGYTVIDAADDPRPVFARPDYPGYMRGYSYTACGWPLRAAEGRFVINSGPSPATSVSRHERMYEVGFAGMSAEIPLRPIWLGLVGNTFFYGAVAFVPLVAWRWRRTRRRRRKNRCVSCGYQLDSHAQESMCPECGLRA